MKKIFFIVILISINLTIIKGQDKTVTLTVSGSGKTQDEAKQSALRSAIEQAFGAFISAKTEILNDKIISDQITSVANGNIQSFDVLNASQLPDGTWGITLKALVSIDKLTSFIEAKGVSVEIKGGLFALNIKQQILNEQAEITAISEMVGLLHEAMQTAFDYSIKSSDPKSVDSESKNWVIPITVTVTANKNMDICANYIIKTLNALSLSPDEVLSYKNLNKMVFPVVINYNGNMKTFYLRKQSSINALNTLTNQWESYTRLFTVQSGIDESNGTGKGDIFNFSPEENENKTINFLTSGQQAAIFSWEDKRTLSQIDKLTGFTVKPRGVISSIVTDIDGNVYRTLIIGTKVWMAENLKTTRYNDGTSIPYATEDATWSTLTTGAYCHYENNIIYARQYNWYAVNTGKLAPKGWHIPTINEWEERILISSLDLPGIRNGRRSWWSSTERDTSNALYFILDWDPYHTQSEYDLKTLGLPVCCVKDN